MKKIFTLLFTTALVLNASAQTETKYRLVIGFHSMCCGVPSAEPLEKYITAFKKQYKIKKIAYDRIGPLGREGEYDMGFKLKELSKKQVAVFVKNVNAITEKMKDRGNADTEENVTRSVTDDGRTKIERKVF